MNRIGRYAVISSAFLMAFAAPCAFAQCQNKSGFAKKVCEAQQSRAGSNGLPGLPDFGDSKTNALTTSFSDAIHLDTLPPSVDPKAFKPLTSLDRADDGAFILTVGIYEAYVQSFTLDAGGANPGAPGAFFPAPIKGRNAKILASLLKESELHPDVPQNDIQQLVLVIVQGMALDKMPPALQQVAARVLPKESFRQLQGAAMADAFLGMINERMSKDRNAQKTIGKINDIGTQMQKNSAATQAAGAGGPAAYAEPVLRGTWAQMPGGFYVRYLPDGYMKTRVQVIVPDAAVTADAKTVLTFDPTQFLAVLNQTPGARLGITLRPVR